MSVSAREGIGGGPWVDPLDHAFLSNPHLTSRDRAFVSHLVNGVWRWRGRLDWMIAQVSSRPISSVSPVVLDILRMALYQVLYMDRVPESAAVNEAVNQVKARGLGHAASFVNGLLRNLCRRRHEIVFPDPAVDPVLALSVRHSYPEWLVSRWIGEFGMEGAEALLAAQNRIPRLDVRVNLLRTTPDELRSELQEEGVRAEIIEGVPGGLSIEGLRGRVDQLAAFEAGRFTVQDRGAQVASNLLFPRPGERILDMCSGLGGKTTHLAELTGDGARVTALDINPGRLVNLRRSTDRLGLRNIDPVASDGTRNLGRLFSCMFDAILLDAPCSGLGVLSRHPDGKWIRSERDVLRLASLQLSLLSGASAVLGPGGRMLFVTCTITKEENEGVVEEFLDRHREMSLVNLEGRSPDWALPFIDKRGFFKTLPHIHAMDGFFGALFTKS